MPLLLNKTLRLFLDGIGRREEYEYYLNRFSLNYPKAFAILVPLLDVSLMRVFSFDLDFLLQLGLDPVVLLCGKEVDAFDEAVHHSELELAFDKINLEGVDELNLMQSLGEARTRKRVLILEDRQRDIWECFPLLLPSLSHRLHVIRSSGPLRSHEGEPVLFYQRSQMSPEAIGVQDRPLLDSLLNLLDRDAGLHISIASPLQLLEELFTVKGAGCVIRNGAIIEHYRGVGALNHDRLLGLLEAAFEKKLAGTDFLARVSDTYLEQNYRGVCLLEPSAHAMYLSKFAVKVGARGEGLAVELWRKVMADYPCLYWRSRQGNPVNQWYERQADGHHHEGDWVVFWHGVTPDVIPELIKDAVSRPTDFVG